MSISKVTMTTISPNRKGIEEKHWRQNARNGLHNLLPVDKIPKE